MSEADGLDAVRRDVAAARGLDERALPFMGGTTVAEIEGSADEFAALIGKGGPSDHNEPDDLFADVARAQAERKQALVSLFTGQPAQIQPRTDDGRYGSYDGGAREPAPAARPGHNEWLAEVLHHRKADAGANF